VDKGHEMDQGRTVGCNLDHSKNKAGQACLMVCPACIFGY